MRVGLLIMLLALMPVALAIELPVVVQRVLDGRTLELRHPGGATSRVQLAGLAQAQKQTLLRLAPRGAHGFVVVGGMTPQINPVLGFVYLCPNLRPCTTTSYNLSAEMLRLGGARLAYNFSDPQLLLRLQKAQSEARKAGRGLWRAG